MAISTNGTVLARVAGALYNTQMSNATYSEVHTLDPAALVNALYARDFSSSTDLAVATTLVTNLGLSSITGLNNWVAAQLTAAGTGNKGAKIVDLLNSFAQMTSDATYGAYATAFNTKVDAALVLSQTTGNAGGTFTSVGSAPVVGATFTLTASSETKTGTAGADTFLALNSGDLSNSDSVDGGAGNDTLYAVFGATTRPVLTSIEVVQAELADQSGAGANNLNFDKSTGIKTVETRNYAASTADTNTVQGVTTATSLKITDDVGGTGRANNYTMTYSGVTGTSDVAAVTINSTTADLTLGTITVSGIEDLTVTSNGGAGASYTLTDTAAKTVTLNASAASGGTVTAGDLTAATTLNINSAADITVDDNTNKLVKVATVNIDSQTAGKTVTLTGLTTTATASATDAVTITVKGAGKASLSVDTSFGTQSDTNADSLTINASANTGGVTVDASASAPRTISVTGGTGNDTITVAAGGLDKYDTIALGDGTADTVTTTGTFGSAGATVTGLYYTDTLTGADLPVISGVEVARINLAGTVAGTNTFSAKSAAFASTVEINAASALDISSNSFTVSNLGAGQSVKLGANLDLDSAVVTLALADATGTADRIAITTDGKNQGAGTDTATFGGITAAGIETVSVDLGSAATANTTVAGGTLTFADATSVSLTGSKITSATVIAKTGATIDASGVTGALTLTANDDKAYTVKGSGTKATEFVLGSYLNNADNIQGGAATTDAVYATINGLTATTGALTISGVETINLDAVTASSTVSAAGITGATNIAIDGSVNLTLTNLKAGTALTLGANAGASGGTATAYTGAVSVSLADATGTSDALTVNLTSKGTGGNVALTTTGIETLNLVGASDMDAQTLDVSAATANSIVITGGYASTALGLTGGASTKLNAATNLVDGSAYISTLTAIAATNTATTFKSKLAGSTFTGSVLNDTIQIGTSTNFVGAGTNTIDGGNGSDTLTVYAKASATLGAVTNVETINIVTSGTAADYTSSAYSITAAAGSPASSPKGIQTATTVNVSGGLAGTTVTLSGDLGDNGARTIDASADLGSISLTFADAGLVQTDLSDAIVIKGGQGLTDVVNVKAAGNGSNLSTGDFTMSGVEKIVLTSGYTSTNAAGANTVSLKNVTGLTTAAVISGSSSDTAAFTNVASGVAFEIGQGSSAMTDNVTIGLTSSTGSSDTLAVKLIATASGTPTLTTDGVETLTLTLDDSTQDHSISLANTNTNAATLNVAGVNTSADLAINSLATAYSTVSATGLKGKLTLDTGAIGSGVYTITGGDGADTIGMKNSASVLDGGAGSDTLNISFTGTGGALIVDLSSTTDQIQMFNGLANAAVQKGFESVNASAYTQTNSVGADITGSSGANTIVGTAYADTIRAGDGADNIIGGAGSDTIDLTETSSAVDTIAYSATSEGSDTVIGFVGGTDVIRLSESAFTLAVSWSSHALDTTSGANNYAETATALSGTAQDLNGTGAANAGAGIVVVGAASGTGGVSIYYTAQIGAATSSNSTLIATLTGINTGNIAATDFLGY